MQHDCPGCQSDSVEGHLFWGYWDGPSGKTVPPETFPLRKYEGFFFNMKDLVAGPSVGSHEVLGDVSPLSLYR